MELSELTAYAKEKFHIREQHKWADFPGISVLADPNTGKWAALLMRQWDSDTGTEIQRCDIKCGRQTLWEIRKPYLSRPFRMDGDKWIGVVFDSSTEPDVVFRLFDRAVRSGEQRGCTIVLESPPTKPMIVCQDTALPAAGTRFTAVDLTIPEKIRQMLERYECKDESFAQKCRNFYRQGKFMEDYEDNAPWTGAYRCYFPTYQNLTVRQLRGYFTWRTRVRKGDFSPIPTSLAYLYLYELLNGIGTSSPEDTLKKMREFEEGFLDSGIGDPGIQSNLRRWMLEYAVLHDLPPALARRYADPAMLKKDEALAVLREPEKSSDEEIFSALCVFAGKKLGESPVVSKDPERGKHLFAAVWRCASKTDSQDDSGLFTACFGKPRIFAWHPLSNAVYWEETRHSDVDYILDECRVYHCRGGAWQEERYNSLYFNRNKFHGLLRETDRLLRRFLKTGHYLRKKAEEAWAAPYAETVIEAERRAEEEAARPKITINLSSLEHIRQDALVTRDRLLTENEMEIEPAAAFGRDMQGTEEIRTPLPDGSARSTDGSATVTGDIRPSDGSATGSAGTHTAGSDLMAAADVKYSDSAPSAPDVPYRQILLSLLRGEPVQACIKASHLMPSVVADAINEALFDEIGDNILECDGDIITLVEDYRDDVLQIFGGKSNE